MKNATAVAVLLILTTTLGCNSRVPLISPIPDGKRTYQEFVSSRSFPYSMQEDKKNKIINNYGKLKIGITKQDVNLILGDPSYSRYLHKKEYPGEYVSSKWTYYFYKPDSNSANEKLDIGIFIFFDVNDKVYWIVPQNIEGLTEKGSPKRNGS